MRVEVEIFLKRKNGDGFFQSCTVSGKRDYGVLGF